MNRDIDESSENVLSAWSRRAAEEDDRAADEPDEPAERDAPEEQPEPAQEPEPSLDSSEQHPAEPVEPAVDEPGSDTEAWGAIQAPAPEAEVAPVYEIVAEPEPEELPEPLHVAEQAEHAVGDLLIPDGYAVLEGEATGGRRAVGIVVSRFNGGVTTKLLERALAELEEAGVAREAITVLVVPGAFELPLAATALAKTRRFACIVALGCVIRGETPHFEYVAGEAASGLQLAALETGVPVSFGVLTLESSEQADARIEKGAEAVRTALEMADVFAHLRAAASR